MSSDRLAAPTDASSIAVLLAVAVGGAVGACLRAAVGHLAPSAGTAFPWSTFWVNMGGSALLALLPAAAVVRRHSLLPPLLGTGVLGGFTTLSAWSQETHDLLAAGEAGLAVAYGAGTLVACLTAVALVGRLSSPAPRESLESGAGDL